MSTRAGEARESAGTDTRLGHISFTGVHHQSLRRHAPLWLHSIAKTAALPTRLHPLRKNGMRCTILPATLIGSVSRNTPTTIIK